MSSLETWFHTEGGEYWIRWNGWNTFNIHILGSELDGEMVFYDIFTLYSKTNSAGLTYDEAKDAAEEHLGVLYGQR